MTRRRSRSALEALLRVRGLAESRAKTATAKAARELAASVQGRLDAEDMVARDTERDPTRTLRPAVLIALRMAGLVADERLQEAIASEEQMQGILGERRSEWVAAHQELDGARRLEERQRVRLARRAAIAEERAMDELVTIRALGR